ncbi:hypothetical protein AMTR_s00062p00112320 [Amborella trichopoda]|uniref:Uncharacterized protein n=1 Tax=Amborella trichopoda TaxID=13333 RepID=U5DDU8_AMBTC|nr:hypothetical protein AMTR_s00062p00112320 [Amborella trichopoda]
MAHTEARMATMKQARGGESGGEIGMHQALPANTGASLLGCRSLRKDATEKEPEDISYKNTKEEEPEYTDNIEKANKTSIKLRNLYSKVLNKRRNT